MKYSLLAVAICISLPASAQTTKKLENGREVTFTYVEQMPKAVYELLPYLIRNIHLKDIIVDDVSAEKVVVRFAVNANGSIADVEVIAGINQTIDKEVLRVISTMPAWIPGRQHGKPARVMYTLPVRLHWQH